MTKDNKGTLYTILTVIACVAIFFGVAVYSHDQTASSDHVRHQDYVRLVNSNEQYNAKHSQVQHELFSNAKDSSDPIIKSVADNTEDNQAVSGKMTKFFRIMYDYDDHTDYIDRPVELHGIATQNVYGNKTVFDNDKDNSGESIVDNEQLHSRFNNIDTYIADQSGDKLTVIADVTFSAWTDGNQSNEGNDIYQMTFDKGSHKITGMKKLMHIANVENE